MYKKVANGYSSCMVWYDKSLSRMPYAQCGVVFLSWGVRFVSYTTTVIEIDNDGWLECFGTYSQTTRKQIGAFLKEYAPKLCYYDAKRCYEKDEVINIYTGETITVEEYLKKLPQD